MDRENRNSRYDLPVKFENIIMILKKECDCMKCPCCGKEMISGVIQSARMIIFTTKAHKYWFGPYKLKNETELSSHSWTRPTCVAYHCDDCKKVVIDYSTEVE